MGQYYKGIILESDKVFKTFYPSNYGSGLKIMEHTFVGDIVTDLLMSSLEGNEKKRLVWLGEYFDEQGADLKNRIPYSYEKIEEFSLESKDCDRNIVINDRLKYIVNHSKKIYINLDKLKSCGVCIFEEDPNDCKDGYIINPLPLLTSYAGSGSGDYNKKFPNSDKVGTWAFDRIGTYEKLEKENYKEYDYDKKDLKGLFYFA